VKVTFAYPWTDPDGVEHKADQTQDLPQELADNLINEGRARPADESKKGGK
jgi:hypothetical protein